LIQGHRSGSDDVSSVSGNSQKPSSAKSLESADASTISEDSQKSSSVHSVQPIDTNSVLLSLQKASSAEIVESADAQASRLVFRMLNQTMQIVSLQNRKRHQLPLMKLLIT